MAIQSLHIEDLLLHDQIRSEKTDLANRVWLQWENDRLGHLKVDSHFENRDWVSILVMDSNGKILLQKERRTKPGANSFSFDLTQMNLSRFRVSILTLEGVRTADILR